jgi:hypothetical protein
MTQLFNALSVSPVSAAFRVRDQTTVTAIGLSGTDRIRFELVELTEMAVSNALMDPCCDDTCFPAPPAAQLVPTASSPLTCCSGCDCTDGVENQQRPRLILPDSPFIIIDAPQNVWIRAIYEGTNLGGFIANYEDTTTKNVTDIMRGCCPLDCPPLVLATAVNGLDAITTTIVSGGPATVTVSGAGVGGVQYEQTGTGPFTFSGLVPSSAYSVVGVSHCGAQDTNQVTTATPPPCPAIVLSAVSNTTSSAIITLTSGAPATVTLNSESQYGAGPFTFTGLTAGKTYTAFAVSNCGDGAIKGSIPVAVQDCPAVNFTAIAISPTSVQVTATAGAPLTLSIVDQSGNVLDSVDGISSTIIFTDLPDGAIVTVKAVNECGKKKQLNVKLPATPVVVSPCPSFSLADASPAFKGFAYVAGDLTDPAATVPFRGGFIYPTAGVGHTVKVTDALGAVIGYAANKSDCANPCCTPLTPTKTSVDGGIINDSTDKYWIYGELKKCDDTNVELTDRVLVKGDLLDCDNLPLPCKPKLKQCCDIEVVVDSVSNRPAPAGVCLSVAPTLWTFIDSSGNSFVAASLADAQAIDPNASGGRAILQLRDKAVLEGGIALDPVGNPGAVASKIFTNPFECDALLEVDLYVGDNYSTSVYANEAITMVHKTSTTLAEPFPVLSLGAVDRTVGIHNINSTGQNSAGGASDGGGRANTENAWMGEYQVVVPASGSITLYAQSWLILYDAKNSLSGGFVIHANKNIKGRWTKGGRIV